MAEVVDVSVVMNTQKTMTLPQIQHIDKIVGVAVAMQHQVPTAPVRRTTDACDSDVQKDDPWSSHRASTLKGTGTSRLRLNINASNTVVNISDSDLATKKDASRKLWRNLSGRNSKSLRPDLMRSPRSMTEQSRMSQAGT